MVSLLSTRGYAATSLSEVLAASEAPRGSIYYHFPGGKDELVEAAVRRTLEGAIRTLEGMRGLDLPGVLAAFAASWRGILEYTDCTGACAIMAVSVGADKQELRELAAEAFRQWEEELADILRSAGMPEGRCAEQARFLLASYEGAVLLGRAQHSLAVFDAVDGVIRSAVLSV